MTLTEALASAINPALKMLPPAMASDEARVMLLTIGQQESRFEFRRQLGDGPARGFWQFERGTAASRGGVWGVFLHPDTEKHLQRLCKALSVPCIPLNIWTALEVNDVLAAGVARLLLFTDPQKLPAVDDVRGSWRLYAERTWRPGRPHPETWPKYHALAREALGLGLS